MGLSKSSQLIESVFAGGGDMGARMRAFDWSATVLGPVEDWPQSLRACVRIVLGAGHPMLISWGLTTRCSTTTPTGWSLERSTPGPWAADIDAAAFSGATTPSGLSDDEKVAYERLRFVYQKGIAYGFQMELRPADIVRNR